MALKILLFLLASFLLVTKTVSSHDEELRAEGANAGSPVPTPPVKPPTVTPSPPTPVVKPPAAPVSPPTVTPKPPVPPVYPPATPKPPVPPVKPPTASPSPPVRTRLDCIPLCAQRCKAHSRKNICARACMTCCERCKCVPPGTYGNKEKCGKCYTEMKTHGGRPKCP